MKEIEFIDYDTLLGTTKALVFELSTDLVNIATAYVQDQLVFIPGKRGVAKKHPKDNYNHKTGRIVARAKLKDSLFKITTVSRVDNEIRVTVMSEYGERYVLVESPGRRVKVFYGSILWAVR